MKVSFTVIGRNIRKARNQLGITQEKMAELLDMSALHYGRLERGERCASVSQLARIAEILNTSIESFLLGSTDSQNSTIPRKKESIGLIIDSLSCGCSDEARYLMIEICRLIAKQDKFKNKHI